jgi:hypothetical protein
LRPLAPRLAVVLGYVLAASAFMWPLPLHLGTHLTGDPGGDTGVYVWNQWVFHQELTTGQNPLTTDRILSLSQPADLSQHNYTAFLNLLALPLISWLGTIAAFNVVFLAVCMMNALITYGLVRRVTAATRAEAWLAGLLFAWAPAMVARTTGHFSLVAAAALPAFVWCLVNAERSRSVRDAVLLGLCMAWAALSDAYYGVYCLMLALLYVAASAVRITRQAPAARHPWLRLLDILIVCLGGLVGGLLLGAGGEFTLLGVPVRVRSLYNPVLVLTLLVVMRALWWWRPHLDLRPVPAAGAGIREPRSLVRVALVAGLACAGPLSPVLYGIGERIAEGRFVNPTIFWRSSPPGVDLLAFVTPNPQHPLARWLMGDPQLAQPTVFVEYTASLSLVAIAIVLFAVWRAGYRPRTTWVAITGGFALLALGPFVHVAGLNTFVPGPWALLRYAPGFGLTRMPTRFSIVVALGLAVLAAGALAAIGAKWPARRRLVAAAAGALLVFELWPAPRTLYSAAISPIYDVIAEDPRPVRVLSLPFGVRDGVSSTGNFRSRSQFNQIRHGKPLFGGYLSRISARRVDEMRRDFPALDALIALSEPKPMGPEVKAVLDARGRGFIERAAVGYVVIDRRFIPDDRAGVVIAAFNLREIQRHEHLTLYVPE